MQVINVTHEGHAVAAAQGYAMASRSLGFFFGSGAGVGNSMSNLYCAWKDRVPMLVTYSGGELSEQGKDGFESWDDHLRPTEPFTMWTASLLTDETLILENVPHLWLFSAHNIDFTQASLKNWKQHATTMLYGFEGVWLEKA